MHLFVVLEDGNMLLGTPVIKLLNILQINHNTIGTQKGEKGTPINAGSAQHCTNTGPEKDCDIKENDADSCTNTGNSLNSNNRQWLKITSG